MKNAKRDGEEGGGVPLESFLADLAREFPLLKSEAAYDGPPAGLFRELDLALLPPPARHTLTALGRLLWRQFEQLRSGTGARAATPLETVLRGIVGESRLAAERLSAAVGLQRLNARTRASRELGHLGVRSLRRLQSLIREIENQLPALEADSGVSDARRVS